MMDLFDHAQARLARDEALQRVRDNAGPWFEVAMQNLRQHLPAGWIGTGEDIRFKLVIDHGCPEPHHHNTWGSLVTHALKRGYLAKTGEYRRMRAEKSHARETKVYRRTGA